NVQEYKTPLVQSGEISTQWHLVTTVAALGDKAVKFVTDSVIGYVIRNDGDDTEAPKGSIIAMSAACTHMGCIVKWQESDNRFHCPCHGGVFTEYGKPDPSSRMRYLVALPRLKTKVENGNIYVEVPVSNV
ncbi:MAG: Rieske 2Fe-2S domain-containing protein, partial [Chloroflexi bacterium]|nr:Rieske 2Fe-2S domain-containing protein [Chloroflexota bacterium]